MYPTPLIQLYPTPLSSDDDNVTLTSKFIISSPAELAETTPQNLVNPDTPKPKRRRLGKAFSDDKAPQASDKHPRSDKDEIHVVAVSDSPVKHDRHIEVSWEEVTAGFREIEATWKDQVAARSLEADLIAADPLHGMILQEPPTQCVGADQVDSMKTGTVKSD